jgi:hypothetical protein
MSIGDSIQWSVQSREFPSPVLSRSAQLESPVVSELKTGAENSNRASTDD